MQNYFFLQGITNNLDKRIKSRFLQRKILFFVPTTTQEVSQIWSEYLELHDSLEEDEQIQKQYETWNAHVSKVLASEEVVQIFEESLTSAANVHTHVHCIVRSLILLTFCVLSRIRLSHYKQTPPQVYKLNTLFQHTKVFA